MRMSEPSRLMIIDDSSMDIGIMGELLSEYKRYFSLSFTDALNQLRTQRELPDLILLDIMMPGMDGYEVCRRLKRDSRTMNIPVIFLTAKAEVEDEMKGLELGAVDYTTKPISPPIVRARVKNHLALKAMADFLRDQNHFLELEVAKRTREAV